MGHIDNNHLYWYFGIKADQSGAVDPQIDSNYTWEYRCVNSLTEHPIPEEDWPEEPVAVTVPMTVQ